jgi:hypothetical protein
MDQRRRFVVFAVAAVAAAGVLVAAPGHAFAKDPPLVGAEAHVAHGITQAGGGGSGTWRESTYLVGVTVDVAVIEEPWTSLYGSLQFEGFDRAAVGGFFGARVRPGRGAMRLSAGAGGMLVPYSALGVTAAGGMCRQKAPQLCLDLEGVFFFAGSDIPDGRVASQFLLKLGVAFDVL